MEEQFNKEAQQGWRFASDAARMTDVKASREDREHTSGEGFATIDRIWEQLLVQKKERLSQSQAMREELSKLGLMCEEECVFLRFLLALGRLDPEE